MNKCDYLSFDQFREMITITDEDAREVFERENKILNKDNHWKTPIPKSIMNNVAKGLVATGKHDWISFAVGIAGRPAYKRKEFLGERKSYPIMLDKNTVLDIRRNQGNVSRSSALEGAYWDYKITREQLDIALKALQEISTMLYEVPREEAERALEYIKAVEKDKGEGERCPQ